MKFHYSILLLAFFFPTPADAILVTLFNIIVSIFFPNWEDQLCNAMTSQLGSFSTDCPCKIALSGFFDFDVTVSCNDVGSTTCDLSLKGGANLFTGLFSGLAWSGTTTCTVIPPPTTLSVNFALGGSVSLNDPADIDTCTVGLTVPSFPVTVVPACVCTLNCNANDPFSVALVCSATGTVLGNPIATVNLYNSGCQNALTVLDGLDGITLPTIP